MEPSHKRHCTPIGHLRTLNEQYARWVQQQLATAPEELWIEAAEDYIQHARSLVQEASGSSEPSAGPQPHTANGKSEAPSAAPRWGAETSQFNASPAASVFSRLGATGKRSGPDSSLPPLFPQPAPFASSPMPSFSFPVPGAFAAAAPDSVPSLPAPAAAVAQAGLFSFPPVSNAAAAPSNTSTAGGPAWSFNTGANGSSFGGNPAPSGAEDAEEEEEAPKEEIMELPLAAGADILFKATAKLHTQKPGSREWVDRGRGMLTVRANPQEDSGTSPSTQVVFTMDSGRVLVNGAVYKGMSITKAKKPSMVLTKVTLATKDVKEDQGAPADPQTVLLNLSNPDKASDFIAIVQKALPK